MSFSLHNLLISLCYFKEALNTVRELSISIFFLYFTDVIESVTFMLALLKSKEIGMKTSSLACCFELFQILVIAPAILSVHGYYCQIYDGNRNLSSVKNTISIAECGAYCIMEEPSPCASFLCCPQSNQNNCTSFTRKQDCDFATESNYCKCGIFSKVSFEITYC